MENTDRPAAMPPEARVIALEALLKAARESRNAALDRAESAIAAKEIAKQDAARARADAAALAAQVEDLKKQIAALSPPADITH
jgi:hypothetical protein